MASLRIVLADDQPLMVEGIRETLVASEDFEVVGEASSGKELIALVARTDPDIVLVGVGLSQMNALTCLELIGRRFPRVKTVVLGDSDDPGRARIVLNRGASAYVVKTVNPADLPSALRQAVEGNVYHALDADSSAETTVALAGLTERELCVLKGVARGLSNQAIGQELWVTEQTVKFHLTNIYRKLGVANRTEATRFAFQHGLVGSPFAESELERAR